MSNHLTTRIRRYAASVAHLRKLADSLGRVPTQMEYHRDRPSDVYGREWAIRNVGGWDRLCKDAGILHLPRVEVGKRPSRSRTPCQCGEYILHKLRVPTRRGTMILALCRDCCRMEQT